MIRGVHNPVQLDAAEVRARFVVRELELEELVTHLREGDPPRHALVVGQRGMGKSLLLRRVLITVTDDADLRSRWLPVLLPEEVYEVTSLGELWLVALNQLAATSGDPALTEQHRALLQERDPARLASLALERLLSAARKHGQKVLLLAENLDMLLESQLTKEEAWGLRQALQTETDLLVIASATTSAAVKQEHEAFYGFFRRIELPPLDIDELRKLWKQITGLDLPASRLRPVLILTGGNPRLAALLARSASEPGVRGLRDSLDLLIDQYTPYFKANIEALPPVERKVFIALAEIWAPATSAEVASRTRMSTSAVSALLARLTGRGLVCPADGERGKTRYEIQVRLFSMYLHRRRGGTAWGSLVIDLLVAQYEDAIHEPVEVERHVLPGPLLQREGSGLSQSAETLATDPLLRSLVEGLATTPAGKVAGLQEAIESYLQDRGTTLRDTDPETLQARELLGLLVARAGDARAALRIYTDLADDYSALRPPDEAGRLSSLHQVAHFTAATGDVRAARDLFGKVAADRARILGDRNPDTLASRRGMAYYTGESGDPHQALRLFREILADSDKELGKEHRDTLKARHGVARCTGQSGDLHLAVELHRELAADYASLAGPDDPATLASRREKAYYASRINPRDALAECQEVAADSERVLGADHPDALASRYDVACCIGQAGDWRTALQRHSEVAQKREEVLGATHAATLASRHEVAYYTARIGDPRKALDLHRELAADCERILGSDHRTTLASRHGIAYCTGRLGDAHAALEFYRGVAADRARVLGADHQDTLASEFGVAKWTARVGDRRAALALATDLMTRVGRMLPDDPLALAIKGLRARLEAQLAAESGAALPRELDEALRASDEDTPPEAG